MATGVFVGVDVSKDKIDVACRGGAEIESVWERTESALRTLSDRLRSLGRCRVVLEASGGYEQAVLDALFAAGVEVFMVQPARARHFAKSLGKYAETDAIDAAVLAHMAEVAVDDDTPWQPRRSDVAELRALVQRRDHLVAHVDAETKRLRAARLAVVQHSLERVLVVLRQERDALEERIEELGERSEHIAHHRGRARGCRAFNRGALQRPDDPAVRWRPSGDQGRRPRAARSDRCVDGERVVTLPPYTTGYTKRSENGPRSEGRSRSQQPEVQGTPVVTEVAATGFEPVTSSV